MELMNKKAIKERLKKLSDDEIVLVFFTEQAEKEYDSRKENIDEKIHVGSESSPADYRKKNAFGEGS